MKKIIGIVFFACIVRLIGVTTVPPSLSWDEVSIGYNAYSILHTGLDEHQRFLPLDTFTAYGDYKPPFAIYATVPSVFLFGLTEFAVRLPSVLFGVLAVLLLYGICLELFNTHPKKEFIACAAACVLAISPWHIQLSRAGFEGNIAVSLLLLGVYLVLLARSRKTVLSICWLPFVAAMYTFNSARYVGPLLCVGLLLFVWRKIHTEKKLLLLGFVLALMALIPILPHLVSKEARLRYTEVNIFTDPSIVTVANARIAYDGKTWWANVFDNRRVGYARSYLTHFFDNLEPRFLFVRGDGNPKFSLQEVGQLYAIEAVFLVIGWYAIFLAYPAIGWLLLYWLIVAIVPAAVARETPHALRIENSLPVWEIVIAFGIYAFTEQWRSYKMRQLGFLIVLVLYAGSGVYFFHNYFTHYAKEYSGEWQYGYKEAILATSALKERYDQIVMTEALGRPYMYVLFYERMSPGEYWQTKDASFDDAGFYNVYGIGKYRFSREGVPARTSKKTLFVMRPKDVPRDATIIQTIPQVNGGASLVLFE